MKKLQHGLIPLFGIMFMMAFFFGTPSAKATATQSFSATDIIEMLIALEIIPKDKAEMARTILKEKAGTKESGTEYCIALTKNLYMGVSDAVSNGEVSKLQKYLKETGDYTHPEITGYFGPATEMAVQKWQTKMKIVTSGSSETTGFGVVGPMTRSKMLCAKMKEQKSEEGKTEENDDEEGDEDDDDNNKDEESTVSSITASVDDVTDKVSWDADGSSPLGYKVVWSKDAAPAYPTRDNDKYMYVTGSGDGSKTVYAFDGSGTYYVRVCEYLDGKCGVYSNEVSLKLTDDDEDEDEDGSGDVRSISLSVDDEDGKVSWDTTGYSQSGYKVVWSLNTGPTYPTRSSDKYLYFSDPDTDSATLEAFKGAGRYHVRVCEYLGGKCGVYSNEVVVTL